MTEIVRSGLNPDLGTCVSGKMDHHWDVKKPSGHLSEASCKKGCGETALFRNSENKDFFGNEIRPTPQLNIDSDDRDAPARLIIPVFRDPSKLRGTRIA